MINISLFPFYMLRSLLLTILFETSLAFLLGVRKKWDVVIVILAQAATNPIVVITTMIAGIRFPLTVYYIVLAAMELAAVITEGIIYLRTLDYRKINPFLLSLILNIFSFSVGEVINYFL